MKECLSDFIKSNYETIYDGTADIIIKDLNQLAVSIQQKLSPARTKVRNKLHKDFVRAIRGVEDKGNVELEKERVALRKSVLEALKKLDADCRTAWNDPAAHAMAAASILQPIDYMDMDNTDEDENEDEQISDFDDDYSELEE